MQAIEVDSCGYSCEYSSKVQKQGNKCEQLLGNLPRCRLEHVKLTNDNDLWG